MTHRYLPKDMVETAEGLVFAVVAMGLEAGRIPCFLRYRLTAEHCEKLSTDAANHLLKHHRVNYLYRSKLRDVVLHGVPPKRVAHHHQPGKRLLRLMNCKPKDLVEKKLLELIGLFRTQGVDSGNLGVTGSLLIGTQTDASDIDIVCYGSKTFHQARNAVANLLANSELQPLDEALWQDAYQRRGCELELDEFIWHEKRKFNKAAIGGTKLDISLVDPASIPDSRKFRKLGRIRIRARVTDDSGAFDYPSLYRIDHPDVQVAISYNHTYTGQARAGEVVEVCGNLETCDQGFRQIVVGTDREAAGEYIKVSRSG